MLTDPKKHEGYLSIKQEQYGSPVFEGKVYSVQHKDYASNPYAFQYNRPFTWGDVLYVADRSEIASLVSSLEQQHPESLYKIVNLTSDEIKEISESTNIDAGMLTTKLVTRTNIEYSVNQQMLKPYPPQPPQDPRMQYMNMPVKVYGDQVSSFKGTQNVTTPKVQAPFIVLLNMSVENKKPIQQQLPPPPPELAQFEIQNYLTQLEGEIRNLAGQGLKPILGEAEMFGMKVPAITGTMPVTPPPPIAPEEPRIAESVPIEEVKSTPQTQIPIEIPTVTPPNEPDSGDEIIQNLGIQLDLPTGAYAFKRFNTEFDFVETEFPSYTYPLWDDGRDCLTSVFTSSAQTATQKDHALAVCTDCSGSLTRPQFFVSYGHVNGSGSLLYAGSSTLSPSKAVYSQLQMLYYGDTEQKFTFRGGVQSDHVYAISVNNKLLKNRLDPGNFQINLAELSGSTSVVATGSKVVSLIDTSMDTDEVFSIGGDISNVYHLVSGSLVDGEHDASLSSYGLVVPSLGLIIINADMMDGDLGFETSQLSNVDADNATKLFLSISGSTAPTVGRTNTYGFEARSSEDYVVRNYFARITKDEFNFSNNPTWVTGSTGEFKYSVFKNSPTSYVTTIGLYNDEHELLAIGKVRTPLRKTVIDDYVFRVRVRA